MVRLCISLCLTAALAEAQPPGGVVASARSISSIAYWAAGPDLGSNLFEQAEGSARLTVVDRVQTLGAPEGDQAQLQLDVRRGTDHLEVEMERAGFPVTSPYRPGVALEGGVRFGRDVYGDTGQGPGILTRAPAAISVLGMASVRMNGERFSTEVPVHVAALSAGIHADDGTFRMLHGARPGDAELVVYLGPIPASVYPPGFILIGFDDVRIDVGGAVVANDLFVDAAAPTLPPPSLTAGTGGSGTALYGNVAATALSMTPPMMAGTPAATSPATTTGTGAFTSPPPLPQAPAPQNAQPATALPTSPTPENAQPATPPPASPAPQNAQPATAIPASPAPENAQPATPLLSSPSPLNAQPSGATPASPAPLNALPATPLPQSPAPLNAPTPR